MTERILTPVAALLLAGAVLAATGCQPCPKTALSLDRVVAVYNANAASVPRLWARARISVTLSSGITLGQTSLQSPTSLLLLAKGPAPLAPADFVLLGKETAAVPIFALGQSAPQGVYYFWMKYGQNRGAWWGRQELAGAPGISLPFDPTQVLSVLSVMELPSDFTKLPTVALTMSADPCAYVLTVIHRQPVSGRILFSREIYFTWSDREPPRPFLVYLLDASGRRVMTARLKDYQPIAGASVQPAPTMPTDIEIDWPPEGGEAVRVKRIHITLSQMTAEEGKGDAHEAAFFKPEELDLPPDRIIQVDAGLEPGGPRE
jgi:hypothetical protein